MADHTKDRDYNYKDFDDVFDKMREEGFVDGIEDTFKDDEDAIITDIGDFEQELKDDIPNESKVFHMKGDHTMWEYVSYAQWHINFYVIACPYLVIMLLLAAWNIFCNIEFNQWWAEGNAYLIINTIYLMVQGFLSFWLVAEIPTWMKHFKLVRFTSMVAAHVYNAIYLISLFKWFSMIFWEDNSKATFMKLLVNMNIGYNLILHWSIIPINLAIISKEIIMEFH